METEIAFTKTEINCLFKKRLRLKLYLPKQKRTINETLIFSKVIAVIKKYIQTEAVFTKIEINNE